MIKNIRYPKKNHNLRKHSKERIIKNRTAFKKKSLNILYIYIYIYIYIYMHTHIYTKSKMNQRVQSGNYCHSSIRVASISDLFSLVSNEFLILVSAQLHLGRRVRSLTKTHDLDMTLNCILCWGSSSRALENVKYTNIAITPRSTLTQSGSTSSGLIYRSNHLPCLKTFNCVQTNDWC